MRTVSHVKHTLSNGQRIDIYVYHYDWGDGFDFSLEIHEGDILRHNAPLDSEKIRSAIVNYLRMKKIAHIENADDKEILGMAGTDWHPSKRILNNATIQTKTRC